MTGYSMRSWSDARSPWRRHAVLLAILAAHALLWSAINQWISPHPDTIDHWLQSRIWSLGYFEHPPMVAWLLRGLTALFGATEAGLEISAQLVNLAVLVLTYAIAAATFGRRAGIFAVLFMESAPYFSAGSTVLQIDQPLMLFWLAALACLLRFQRTRRGRWLILMGVFAGLGGLSKYTMVLFYLSVAAYLTIVPAARREWRNPSLYLGGLIALLVVSPVLYWNWQHDWISIRYQLGKGSSTGGPSAEPVLAFTVGWFFLFSAVSIVWGVRAAWPRLRAEGLRDSPLVLLWIVSLAPLAFFSAALSRGAFPDPKWANVGFLGLFLILGKIAADLWEAGQRRRVLRAAIVAHAVNFALIALLVVHIFYRVLPIDYARDRTRQLLGYREAARQIQAVLREQGRALPSFILAPSYRVAAPFALHMPGQPLTYSFERPQRNLWASPDQLTPENTLFICSMDCWRETQRVQERLGIMVRRIGRVRPVVFGVPRAEFELHVIVGPVWHEPM